MEILPVMGEDGMRHGRRAVVIAHGGICSAVIGSGECRLWVP